MSSPLAVTVDPLAPCADFPPTEWDAIQALGAQDGAPLFPYSLDAFQKHAVVALARLLRVARVDPRHECVEFDARAGGDNGDTHGRGGATC